MNIRTNPSPAEMNSENLVILSERENSRRQGGWERAAAWDEVWIKIERDQKQNMYLAVRQELFFRDTSAT